jgi:hypothetical protein
MPSIINAATSGGLISTADTSGVLQLQTASTTAMNIGANQQVGVGTTSPVVFGSTKKGIQYASGGIIYGDTSNPRLEVLANSYFDGSSVVRVATGGSASFTLFENGIIGFGSNTTSGSAGAATTNTSVLSMSKGNSIALEGASSVAGTGITFPATQSASSDANTLDDYEEGTFTPTLLADGSNPTVGYAGQLGRYTKIGNTVFVEGYLGWNSISGGSGSVLIGGLPFAAGYATDNRSFQYLAAYGGLTFTGQLMSIVSNGAVYALVYYNNSGTVSSQSLANSSPAGTFRFSFNYVV